jgi:hypothetical protein
LMDGWMDGRTLREFRSEAGEEARKSIAPPTLLRRGSEPEETGSVCVCVCVWVFFLREWDKERKRAREKKVTRVEWLWKPGREVHAVQRIRRTVVPNGARVPGSRAVAGANDLELTKIRVHRLEKLRESHKIR